MGGRLSFDGTPPDPIAPGCAALGRRGRFYAKVGKIIPLTTCCTRGIFI